MFGGPAWTRVPDGQWYLHLFDSAQPDWNWRNPWVATMFDEVLRFWLDRDVGGFRIDVAHGLFKDAALPDLDDPTPSDRVSPYYHQSDLAAHYRSWRAILDSYPGNPTAVGEIWVEDPQDWQLYLDPGGLPQLFNFLLLRAPWSADAFRRVIDTAFATLGASPTWVLGNHDIVRQVTRYGLIEPATGVMTQPGTMVGPNAVIDEALGTRRARAAALLLLALPGSAYIYQGDELGLPEVLDLPLRDDPMFRRSVGHFLGRDGCRVPMPWSDTTEAYGWHRPWLAPPDNWTDLTVSAQQADPASTLSAVPGRGTHPAISTTPSARASCAGMPRRQADSSSNENRASRVRSTSVPGPMPLPGYGKVLLASGPLDDAALPPDTAVWLQAD